MRPPQSHIAASRWPRSNALWERSELRCSLQPWVSEGPDREHAGQWFCARATRGDTGYTELRDEPDRANLGATGYHKDWPLRSLPVVSLQSRRSFLKTMSTDSRRTPVDDSYPTCVETRAELLVYPGDLAPSVVTAKLGVAPTQENVAGEFFLSRRGTRRLIKTNAWFLSSEEQVDSLDVRRHLDWLIEVIGPRQTAILDLQSIAGVNMAIQCAWYSRSGHGGPVLWPEQMRAIAELNLECGFDVYFPNE